MKTEDFAVELRALRERTGLSQEEFGKKMNVSKRSICSWESGHGFPKKSFRIQLATTFCFPADRFLLDEEKDINGKIYDELQSPAVQNAIQNFIMKI